MHPRLLDRLEVKKNKSIIGLGFIILVSIFLPVIYDGVFQAKGKIGSKIEDLVDSLPEFQESSIRLWEKTIIQADQNRNGISDKLEYKLSSVETGEASLQVHATCQLMPIRAVLDKLCPEISRPKGNISPNLIPVIVHFPDGNIEPILSLFKLLGGDVKSVYNLAINGFAGSIDQRALIDFADLLQQGHIPFLIEEDTRLKANLYYLSRSMNLRPYVWNTLNYTGDQYSSVAVLDTGLDDSHVFFNPGYANSNFSYKIVGWQDIINGTLYPYDDEGHGSHCAGIISGEGGPPLDGLGRIVSTYSWGLDMTGDWLSIGTITMVAARFNVTNVGPVEVQCEFDDYSTDDVDISAYLYNNNTLVDSYVTTQDSWSANLTYNASTINALGDYQLRIRVSFTGTIMCRDPHFRFRGEIHWPFNPPLFGSGDPWKGVAPDTHLVGVKILDQIGTGYSSDLIAGINWVIANRNSYNITVISLSVGGAAGDTGTINAVNNAVANGIVTVVSAGNDDIGGNNIGSPGDADKVLTVAAVSFTDNITDYSSEGGLSYTGATVKPDLAAPGGSGSSFTVFSTDTNDNDGQGEYGADKYPNETYPAVGTSMAAPAVAGAANLLIEAMGGYPNWNYSELDARRVKALLLMTATETYPLTREIYANYSPVLNRGGKDVHEGYGRLNIDAALEACSQKLPEGSSKTAWLSSSLIAPFDKHALAGYADLQAGEDYYISLNVPTGADFDLQIYSNIPTANGEPILVEARNSTVLGQDEEIWFRPNNTGRYYIIAKSISGAGFAELYYKPNTNPPALTAKTINPASGNQSTLFNFSIVYSDIDNSIPTYVRLDINDTTYAMNQVDPLDYNFTDGCLYSYSTYLQPANYTYSFECSDGKYINATGIYTDLSVTKMNLNTPSLSNGTVTPRIGANDSMTFVYRINYTDLDNNAPDWMRVTINSRSYSMVQENPLDVNYMDGALYVFATDLQPGTYSYYFNGSDGSLASAGPYEGPIVEFTIPLNNLELTGIQIGAIISHGEANPRTKYPSISSELLQRGATILDVDTELNLTVLSNFDIIWFDETGGNLTGSETDAVDQWVMNGGSFLITGDNLGSATGVMQRFNITHELQISGNITNEIDYHRITFGVNQLDFPSPLSLNLTNQPNANICVTLNTDIVAVAMEYGKGGFVILADDDVLVSSSAADNHLFINNTFGWLANIKNKNKPILTNPSFNPLVGNQSTLFNFTVTYSDQDNDSPILSHLIVNGTAYLMDKIDSLDTNYTDGCLYSYSTYLQPGSYSYSYEFADLKHYSTTKAFSNLTVSFTNLYSPQLLNPQVSPILSGNTTYFNFTVWYFDEDNNFPEYINVTLNMTSCKMSPNDPFDKNVMDGKLYQLITLLNFGYYRFQVNCSDGTYMNATDWVNAPEVNPFFEVLSDSIKINEIYAGNLDYIELYNYGEDTNMTGWTLYIYHDNALDRIYTFPVNWIFHSEYTLVVDDFLSPDTNTHLYIGGNIPWDVHSIAVGLFDSTGAHIDWFQTSTYTGPTPGNIAWYQDQMLVIANNAAYRTSDRDNDSASDWITSGTGSYGTLNPGQMGKQHPTIIFLTPANGSAQKNVWINFTWYSLELPVGPTTYIFQFSNTSDFSYLIIEINNITETPGISYANCFLNVSFGQYYWRVRPYYNAFYGNWSSSGTITIQESLGSSNLLIWTLIIGISLVILVIIIVIRKGRKSQPKKQATQRVPDTTEAVFPEETFWVAPASDEGKIKEIEIQNQSSDVLGSEEKQILPTRAQLPSIQSDASEIILKLRYPEMKTRIQALKSLGELGDELAIPVVTQVLLYDRTAQVRATAAAILGKLGARGELALLKRVSNEDSDPQVRETAAHVVQYLKKKKS